MKKRAQAIIFFLSKLGTIIVLTFQTLHEIQPKKQISFETYFILVLDFEWNEESIDNLFTMLFH